MGAIKGNTNAQRGDKPKDGKIAWRCALEDKSRWTKAAQAESRKLIPWIEKQLNEASAHVPQKSKAD